MSVDKSHCSQHRSDRQGQKEALKLVTTLTHIKDRGFLALVTGPHSRLPAHSFPAPQTRANWL